MINDLSKNWRPSANKRVLSIEQLAADPEVKAALVKIPRVEPRPRATNHKREVEAALKRWQNPSCRAKHKTSASAAQKKLWADPNVRPKLLEQLAKARSKALENRGSVNWRGE